MIPYPFHQVHNSIGDYRRQRMDVSSAYFCRMKTSRENTRYCLLNFRYKGSRVVTMVWIWISVRTYEATDAVARCFTHARWSGFCRTPRACKKKLFYKRQSLERLVDEVRILSTMLLVLDFKFDIYVLLHRTRTDWTKSFLLYYVLLDSEPAYLTLFLLEYMPSDAFLSALSYGFSVLID